MQPGSSLRMVATAQTHVHSVRQQATPTLTRQAQNKQSTPFGDFQYRSVQLASLAVARECSVWPEGVREHKAVQGPDPEQPITAGREDKFTSYARHVQYRVCWPDRYT